MDVATLRAFVEVMRRRSFASVAHALGVDPSSVSRAISGLESEIGVRLFQRTTRSLSPTEAALAYFERLEPILSDLEEAALVAADGGDTPRGVLRLTAAVSFAQANLMPLLPEFSRRFPELKFDLILTDKSLDLIEERVDLAIRVGQLSESSLIAHRLCGMVYVACASPEYLRRRGRPKVPEDLEDHDCVRYPVPGFGSRWRFRERDGGISDVPVNGRVVVNNMVALAQCAAAGMGVAMLPRWNAAADLRAGRLVDLFPEYRATASEFDLGVWIVYPSRSYLPRKVRLFADFLKEKFRRGAPAEEALPPAPERSRDRTHRRSRRTGRP